MPSIVKYLKKKKVENRVTHFFSLKIACQVSGEEVWMK